MWKGVYILTAAAMAATPAGRALAQVSAPTRIAPQNPAAIANAAHDPAESMLSPSPPPDSALRDLTEFMDRAAHLKDSDVEGRLSLARWCRDHEMWSQAAEMANQVLYRDPGNRAAYTILQQVDDARPLPEEPDVEKSLLAETAKSFHHDFKIRNSKHFLIVYDTTDAFAAQRGQLMEKTYDAFQFYFNMSTLRPDFLDHRLVVLLLKSRDDYLAYGRRTEHADLSWASGFFSQRTNRSTFYDDSSGPTAASVARDAEDLRNTINDLNRQIAAANAQNQKGLENALTLDRNRAAEALGQINARVGNTVQMLNNTKTLHESAHQIAFNTGIQSRLVDYPMWFSEGLACSFEVEDAAGRRGPAVLNWGRIAGIKEALKAGKLMPIEDFITAPLPAKMDEATTSLIYCEGWALFHYLYKTRRDGMENYLLAYKSHATLRPISADERKVLFTRAFGDDLDELNKQFVNYLRGLPARPN